MSYEVELKAHVHDQAKMKCRLDALNGVSAPLCEIKEDVTTTAPRARTLFSGSEERASAPPFLLCRANWFSPENTRHSRTASRLIRNWSSQQATASLRMHMHSACPSDMKSIFEKPKGDMPTPIKFPMTFLYCIWNWSKSLRLVGSWRWSSSLKRKRRSP